MYALRRQIAAPRTHELPRELARQSEAKCEQSPQSETNVCRQLLVVQVTVEGEGWMVLAIDNCDYGIF